MASFAGKGRQVLVAALSHSGSDDPDRDLLLGPDLGRVEDVEVELELVLILYHLHLEVVLGVVAHLDGFQKITSQEIRVLAADLLRLVPDQPVGSQFGLLVKLNIPALALAVIEPEGVHPQNPLSSGSCGECPGRRTARGSCGSIPA